jgi:hypothetical protein
MLILSCNKKLESDKFLENSIREKVLSGQRIMDLNEIADFKWDSLIILTPYSIPENLSEKFEADFSAVEHTGIQHRDDINLIIFFDEGEIKKLVEYPRYPGDFSDNKVSFIKRNEAKFQIMVTEKMSTEGNKWINVIKE